MAGILVLLTFFEVTNLCMVTILTVISHCDFSSRNIWETVQDKRHDCICRKYATIHTHSYAV